MAQVGTSADLGFWQAFDDAIIVSRLTVPACTINFIRVRLKETGSSNAHQVRAVIYSGNTLVASSSVRSDITNGAGTTYDFTIASGVGAAEYGFGVLSDNGTDEIQISNGFDGTPAAYADTGISGAPTAPNPADLIALSPWNLAVLVDYTEGGSSAPVIVDVDEDNTITLEQQNVSIDITNGSSAVAQIRQGGFTYGLNEDSSGASEVIADMITIGTTGPVSAPHAGSASMAVVNGDAQEDTQAITITDRSGSNTLLIGTPNADPDVRLDSTADAVAGDYVMWFNVAGGVIGDVTVNDDLTFDVDDGVTAFDFQIWAAGDGTWGDAATQTIEEAGDDETPDAFAFTDTTNQTPSSTQTSNTITVAGLGVSVAVSITGGTYSKNGGGYTSASGTATNGDTFSVRHTASASYSTGVSTVLNIGTGSDTFTSTTRAEDVTPAAFSFTDLTGVEPSEVQTSNTITVSGLDTGTSVAVSITGGTYSKNGGAYVSSAGTAVNGDTFAARHTASASLLTAVNTALTIGGVSDTFTTTTRDTLPTFASGSGRKRDRRRRGIISPLRGRG